MTVAKYLKTWQNLLLHRKAILMHIAKINCLTQIKGKKKTDLQIYRYSDICLIELLLKMGPTVDLRSS